MTNDPLPPANPPASDGQPSSGASAQPASSEQADDSNFEHQVEASRYRVIKAVILAAVVLASILISAVGYVSLRLAENVNFGPPVHYIPQSESVDGIKRFLFNPLINPVIRPQIIWYGGGASREVMLLQDEHDASVFWNVSLSDKKLRYRLAKNLTKHIDFDDIPMISCGGRFWAFKQNLTLEDDYGSNFIVLISQAKENGAYYVSPHGKLTDTEEEKPFLQFFEWSPYSDTAYVFVYARKVYYVHDHTVEDFKPLFLKSESDDMRIYAEGIPSWVYSEEVFNHRSSAIWWAEDKLIFGIFDEFKEGDEQVEQVQHLIPYVGSNTNLTQKGGGFSFRKVLYPEVGQLALRVELAVVAIGENKMERVDEGFFSSNVEVIIGSYAPGIDEFVAFRFFEKSVCAQIGGDKNLNCLNRGWRAPSKFLQALPIPSQMPLFVYNINGSDTDGVCTIQQDTHNIHCMHWEYEIDSIVGYDNERSTVFAYSNYGRMGEYHLLALRNFSFVSTTILNDTAECITCELGDECLHSSTTVSPFGEYLMVACDGVYRETVFYVVFTKDLSTFHKLNYTRSTPEQVAKNLEKNDIKLPTLKFDTVNTSLGYEAEVRLILPPELDDSMDERYSVVLSVYEGPGDVQVLNKTPSSLESYLASMKNYVVVNIDARGSGRRGWKLRKPLYKNLGGPEVDDLVEVLAVLLDRYPFMDRNRVGVLGWSYGGFATLHFANRDKGDIARCAMAIAPITDFRRYDRIYTERYMGILSPSNASSSESRYARANLLDEKKVEVFRHNVSLMLVHSLSDDNVHAHHSILLSDLLQSRNIPFSQMYYVNRGHSLGDRYANLIYTMGKFFEECFDAI